MKIGFWGLLGQPNCGISATIRIGREMICLPCAGFLKIVYTPTADLFLFLFYIDPLDHVKFSVLLNLKKNIMHVTVWNYFGSKN